MISRNTYHTHTHSFAAGFITASVFFMIPVLLVPNIRAEFMYSGTMDYTTQDIDMDGIDDAFDTSFSSAMPEMDDGGMDAGDIGSSSSMMPDMNNMEINGDTGGDAGGDTGGIYEYNSSSSAAIETGLDCDGDGYMDDPCSYACWDDMDGDGVMDDPCSE
ncbi:hypothetical protein COU78_03180 [Candidatus Peregrinibacteria bacterium CG10_big_fil_rev_8_21_14_0_10_49_24]|nr:MAG: hypothetical protein COV83_05000 [Candidatus Peregrinibacteria bacterium CG11_big_fil_rev_8_21_14_0_20_49_14]PIR51128.1 MAG: hypothetical protein COU78_03180 [Candidatus Peregrinibacteria bacterium CG10_big_fil_rev_8_21_14_0_10_49_24]